MRLFTIFEIFTIHGICFLVCFLFLHVLTQNQSLYLSKNIFMHVQRVHTWFSITVQQRVIILFYYIC